MRVLVTGAQGFLGRHVVACLLGSAHDPSVLGVGRSPPVDGHFTHQIDWVGTRPRAPLPPHLVGIASHPAYEYVPADVRDERSLASLLATFRPEVVIHVAAALRDDHWHHLLKSNVEAAASLVSAAATTGDPPARIVLVSSGSVYGTPRSLPVSETAATDPRDVYAASKRAGEELATALAFELKVPLTIGRVFNLLGPGLQDRHLPASLAGQLAAISLGAAPPSLRLGPLHTSRDYIDVRDAAAALVAIAERGDANAVYNVASGTETPVSRILELLLATAGLERRPALNLLQDRSNDVDRTYADVRLLNGLGCTPSVSLERALGEMLDYYLSQVSPLGLAASAGEQ